MRAAEPPVDAGPGHRPLAPDEVGGREDGADEPQPAEDRKGEPQDGAVGVVERDGEGAGRRRRGHGLGEGRPAVATIQQRPQLPFEAVRDHREGRGPPLADGVIGEDEHVAHA